MFFVTAGYAWPCHIANHEENQQTREAGQSIPDMLRAIGETQVQIPALWKVAVGLDQFKV